jgi:GNAT superfamily N-acetyltransferase
MSDDWMPTIKLKLTRDQFERLPRHPAYKYERIDGITYISPWPRHAHATLQLSRFRAADEVPARLTLRPATAADIEALIPIQQGAFAHEQPYGSMSDADAQRAIEKSLRGVFAGLFGPLAAPASLLAVEDGQIIGAILITLLPGGDRAEHESYEWFEPAPSDLWATRQGQPHLTWIFVRRLEQGTGVGTFLLRHTVRALKRQRYRSLWSTFLIGNDSSLRWHWRNGFELAENIFSKRRLRRQATGRH